MDADRSRDDKANMDRSCKAMTKSKNIRSESKKMTPAVQAEIFALAEEAYGVTRSDILMRRRSATANEARVLFVREAIRRDYRLSEIGRVLERDHTTIAHHAAQGGGV